MWAFLFTDKDNCIQIYIYTNSLVIAKSLSIYSQDGYIIFANLFNPTDTLHAIILFIC